MAVDRRCKNHVWNVMNERGEWYPGGYDGANLAVLMDIRDELQILNKLFNCRNFIEVPATLRAIKRNTTRKKT